MSLGIFQLLSFILLMDPAEVIAGPPQAQDLHAQSLDEFRQRYLLPLISSDTRNCSLNACESLGIVSQLLMLINSMPNGTQTVANKQKPSQAKVSGQGNGDGNSGEVNVMSHLANFDLVKRVRQIESRLRSVEQPIWHLATGSQIEWNHCTSGVCRCNPDTKSFTCWNTNLKSVPVTQVIPMNMVNIDLSRNILSTLHKDTFRGLTVLKELDVSHNVLDFLPFDLFQDLDSLLVLRIQNNQLEDIDHRTFWKLRNLNILDLSKNEIGMLPESIFYHAQRLTVINMCDNQIQNFPPNLLRDQLMLEELDMSRNKITELSSGSIRYLAKLKTLDFGWNQIAKIDDDFFVGLKSLRTLSLHNNRISSLSATIFSNLANLVTLDLTTNRISHMDGNAFVELNNLHELFLGQNSMSSIPADLFLNVSALTRLTLFSNNLTTLEADDFQGLSNLKILLLNNNILKNFDARAFEPLAQLEKLRIDSNKLMYLPHGSLHGLEKLVAVKLDKNPWHCDCRALYLARWIREFVLKLWDGQQPMCRGPGDLGGHEVGLLRYDDLCDGQWASMLSLSPRLPVRKHQISTPMNYTDYFNLYLKHIYNGTTDEELKEADITSVAIKKVHKD
ncbi:leucine-rich repeat-containing protein 15 [Drosophila biarmipes]|uniref:leucine-rich repeat-containing protein 15 n=1 Tax=Drosophila biarmipes TaxID=125945 RepID=UPI0007E5EF41|nr:leucine-rich repeat-containing protein 15 [Drosophila biarmipes]